MAFRREDEQADPTGLRAWLEFYRDLGVYDLYRGAPAASPAMDAALDALLAAAPRASGQAAPADVESNPAPAARQAQAPAVPLASPAVPTAQPAAATAPAALPPSPIPAAGAFAIPRPTAFNELAPLPGEPLPPSARPTALQAIRDDIGDCTRCPLAYAGRRTIVFGDGLPSARLMFVGEGPGADEDAQGLPFVGKSGQLLNNMIAAMGLARAEVYVANIVKCRPPANRAPEPVEANTCTQFLVRQIDVVRPEVIVALGSTAATYLLGTRQSLGSLRGAWHDVRGAKCAVTYHPAYLLRDPAKKGEAWKDLQRVMAELGLKR